MFLYPFFWMNKSTLPFFRHFWTWFSCEMLLLKYFKFNLGINCDQRSSDSYSLNQTKVFKIFFILIRSDTGILSLVRSCSGSVLRFVEFYRSWNRLVSVLGFVDPWLWLKTLPDYQKAILLYNWLILLLYWEGAAGHV